MTPASSGKPNKDFSARSYFDVYVDVDLPGLGTLYNKDPLLIENDLISGFPPTVVYIHGDRNAAYGKVAQVVDEMLRHKLLRMGGIGIRVSTIFPSAI